jgi:1-acyl-sn-glycerol-3-phosphate acyltransferase
MFYEACWWVIAPTVRGLWRVRAEGRQHVPKKGPAILASNHLSFLDHFVLGSTLRRQIFYISKAQHFERPVRRWFFTRWGVIPLNRGEGDKEAFDRSVEVLQEGHLYAIYPEGTRSLDGRLHRGHTGVARLHLMTGAPIVPVAMVGTFEALPKGRSRPRFNKCAVRYGAPLDFSDRRDGLEDRATLREVTDEVMRAVQRLSGQEYVDEYQYNPEVKGHARDRDERKSDGNGRQAVKKA